MLHHRGGPDYVCASQITAHWAEGSVGGTATARRPFRPLSWRSARSLRVLYPSAVLPFECRNRSEGSTTVRVKYRKPSTSAARYPRSRRFPHSTIARCASAARPVSYTHL